MNGMVNYTMKQGR